MPERPILDINQVMGMLAKSKKLMGSDGWEYDSIADKLLDIQSTSSLHNMMRRRDEALQKMASEGQAIELLQGHLEALRRA